MKIALVLIANSNLGNNLTNWALYNLVGKLRPDDQITCINAPREYYPGYSGCDLFCMFKYRKGFNAINPESHYELNKNMSDDYDLFICGSDQIWRFGFSFVTDLYPYMNWVPDNKNRISFATSFGVLHYEGNRDDKWFAAKLIGRFDHISVRESSGREIIRSEFKLDKNVEWVLDPVLLCTPDELSDLASYSRVVIPDEYIATYLWDRGNLTALDKVKNALNIKMSVSVFVKESMNTDLNGDDEEKGVEDWIRIIKESRLLMTDSYHGVCVAISLGKDFFFIRNDNSRGFNRISELLGRLGLINRIISGDTEISNRPDQIDYERVNRILDCFRAKSIAWLKNSISDNVHNDRDEDDIFWKLYEERQMAKKKNAERFRDLYQQIIKEFSPKKEIVVWGCGDLLFRYHREVKEQLGVTKVFDNDKNKWGSKFMGLDCFDPESIRPDYIVLIMLEPVKYNYEIKEQLRNKGITDVVSFSGICNITGRL